MGVWQKYGLVSRHMFRRRDLDPRYSMLPREARFRLALEEQGGLYALFGCFLAGRADLLPSPHLKQLATTRLRRDFQSQNPVVEELRGRVSDLRPLRIAPLAEIYEAKFQGRPAVLEVGAGSNSANNERAWKEFSLGMRGLEGSVEDRVTEPRVLSQFREWIALAGDLERKRTMLSHLQNIPTCSVTKFPRLIPDLQSESCLVYTGTRTEPLSAKVRAPAQEGRKALQLLVEALLEQSLLLSLIDAEGRLENFTVLPNGSLGFCVLPVLAPVPLEWNHELLQYMAATVADQSPRALQMLSRMSCGHDPYAGEQRLMRELSGLQPELKINVVTPESVASLENYWRALANSSMNPPLFLQLFHRQWTLVGQYNGEIAPDSDLIAECLWPVLGRILRYRLAEMASADKLREWAANSGLMLLTAARQAGMLLEQVRDNDLALLFDRQELEPGDAKRNRRTLSIIRSAIALSTFLLAAYLAYIAAGPAIRIVAGTMAVISALVLIFFVAKIE